VRVLAGIVQKRHLETKKTGRAFPRIHALVYDVGDGILKQLELDEASMFKKYSEVYGLFPQETVKVAPVADAGVKTQCSDATHKPACTCGGKH
jgi:hypothetical protein